MLYLTSKQTSLKILITVVIHKKADPVISNSWCQWCQQVHCKYVSTNFFTGSDTDRERERDTHTDFALMSYLTSKQTCHIKHA